MWALVLFTLFVILLGFAMSFYIYYLTVTFIDYLERRRNDA